jgi:RNA polymerase sigma-70 factor (ECF subfamily)
MKKSKLTQVYSLYAKDVYRFALFLTKNYDEAQDITSEAFSRLMDNATKIASGKEKSWLFSTVKNIYRETYRAKSKNNQLQEKDYEYISGDSNLEEEVENNDIQKVINTELDKLPSTTKEIIILKTWYNMKFSEIANVLDMGESAVKLRYYRGLDKLKVNVKKSIKIRGNSLITLIGALKFNEFYRVPNFDLPQIQESILSFKFFSMGTLSTFFQSYAAKLGSVAVLAGVTGGSIALGTTYYYNQVKDEDQKENTEFVAEESQAIPSTCEYNGVKYKEGATFQLNDSCTVCECSGGIVVCNNSQCEQKAAVDASDSERMMYSLQKFAIDLNYDSRLGGAQSEVKDVYSDEYLFCESESVSFSKSDITVSVLYGWPDCIGAGGPMDYEKVAAKDGKEFYVYRYYNDENDQTNGVTAVYAKSFNLESGPMSFAIRFNSDEENLSDVMLDEELILDMIKNLEIPEQFKR